MSSASPAFEFVRIPRPGRGHAVAHEAATLLLQAIEGIQTPTEEEVQRTIAKELDGNLSLAIVDPEGSVVGTGGILFVEDEGVLAGGIVNVAVAPDERHRGLGTRIMSRLERGARRAGAKELFGTPRAGVEEFYRNLGYQPAQRSYIKGDIFAKSL